VSIDVDSFCAVAFTLLTFSRDAFMGIQPYRYYNPNPRPSRNQLHRISNTGMVDLSNTNCACSAVFRRLPLCMRDELCCRYVNVVAIASSQEEGLRTTSQKLRVAAELVP
jgi:hypothetical protein